MSEHVLGDPAVPTLRAVDITKSYGGVHALKGVGIELYPGEVHGLCGENGSGKSTLLKVMSAQIQPDSGRLEFESSEIALKSPVESLRAGIATVTQERTLVPQLTVAENVMLGHTKSRKFWGIDWRTTRSRAEDILKQLNVDQDVNALVSEIPPGQAQLVEIARAISGVMKVLILDEPTSSLSGKEVESLFTSVRELRERGVAIVFISHRMEEVFDICDRITVLRDGRRVSSGPISDYTPDGLVSDMLGRELSAFHADTHQMQGESNIVTFDRVSVARKFQDVTFDLYQGEILGIAGLVGAGHSEVVESIFGLHPGYEGAIRVRGKVADLRDPRRAMKEGIAFVPGDRKANGLVLDMSVLENSIMASTSLRARFKNPRPADAVSFVKTCIKQFSIVTESLESAVIRLSGGNQQKVLLSKWIGTSPQILVLDDPTRGVDVGAKAEIYRILLNQRDEGTSILVSSSEVPELLTLCDRIAVMHRGRIAGILRREEADQERILKLAMGHE